MDDMRSLTLAAAALLAATSVLASDSVSHRFEASAARAGVRRIVVDVSAGSINIRNGSGDRIVATGAVRREYDDASDRVKQQRVVDDIGVEIYVNGDAALISRKLGDHARGWSARNNSDYSVTLDVPQGLDLDIRTKAGEVHVKLLP